MNTDTRAEAEGTPYAVPTPRKPYICIRVQTLSLITGREGVTSFWGEWDRSP